jgi:hypothetical protein
MISSDPHEVMPPPTSPLKLTTVEKDLIRRWIEQGADWQEHWAFVKPVRPALPEVKDKNWPKNEIDRFVLWRLEEQGLKPSPEADRVTLIRRVTMDLTGLPPTLEEVNAFVADKSPNAYEKVVDRLLASSHYGEQMAVTWLDYARYADSHGFQSDPERFMWHWRDWVIDAYNKNMPFDEFAIEQVAGDLLPNATDAQKIATGFNRNHRMNSEGGVIDEEWRVETVIDRVETTSATFMALTMGCCRCHDHKFDPITQKEFYSFCAYFNSVNEKGEYFSAGLDKGKNAGPLLHIYTGDQKERVDALKALVAADEAKLKKLRDRVPDLEKEFVAGGSKIVEPENLFVRFPLDGKTEGIDANGKVLSAKFEGKSAGAAAGAATYVDGKFGKAIKVDGESVNAGNVIDFERTDAFSYGCWVKLAGVDGSIISKMDDGPTFTGIDLFVQGRRVAPHFVSNWPNNALKVATKGLMGINRWVHVMVTYDGSSKPSGVKVYFDGVSQDLQTENDSLKGSIKCKAPLTIGRRVNSSPLNGMIEDVRFYRRVLSHAEVAELATGPDLAALTKIAPGKRNAKQKTELAEALLAPLPEYSLATEDKDKKQAELDGLSNDEGNSTMIMEDLPKPRDTFVLIRGQYDQHGEKVQPGVPAILNPMPKDAPPNRLGLARWIVSDDNPLTARVQVNRYWEHYFGTGLVKTSENFGTQTEWPSHPELLDWLATEFMARKWDMKAMQKLIVMSATYQQASNETAEMIEGDPENRLLAHGPRFRLSAEEVRDQALAVSGLLVEKLGGPPVKPYEPGNLWEGNLFGNLASYNVDSGEKLYRRTLYTFLKRTAAPANLMVFDMPSREYCVIKRSRTNTPLQALDVMNDPTYVEASRVLAEKMMKDGGATVDERIAYGFKRATSRAPQDAELKILREEYDDQLQKYSKDKDAAKKLISVGASKADEKLDSSELAAYTMTASVILNLDEMITRP